MTEPIREQRGRLVRETWVTWAKRHRSPKKSWLVGWDDLDEDQREVDMLIGEAVAEAERERLVSVIGPERFRKLADWLDDDDVRKARLYRNHLWLWPSARSDWQDDLRRFADLLGGDPS
jgi:hypothetical protein